MKNQYVKNQYVKNQNVKNQNVKNQYYPLAFIALIFLAVFVMYGGMLSPDIDLHKYREVCSQYQTAAAGTYTREQRQMLVSKVNYLFPETIEQLDNPLKKEIKKCSTQIEKQLKNSSASH